MDRQRSLRAIVAVNELISDRLRVIGIDPALAETLRRGEEAVAELAAIPDTLGPENRGRDDPALGIYQCGRRGAPSQGENWADGRTIPWAGEHWVDLANARPLSFCVYH
jgi:hypothetical protein